MVYRYGYLRYRYGHLGYQCGIGAKDVGDDSIDVIISHIDMGYLITLRAPPHHGRAASHLLVERTPPRCSSAS
jgi:hypothetical protein